MRYGRIEVSYQREEDGCIGYGQHSFVNSDISDSSYITLSINVIADLVRAAIKDYEKKVKEKQESIRKRKEFGDV